MTIKLEALSSTDGTGIFRSEDTLRLIRPPYTLRESPVLPEAAVQDAILRFGFLPSVQQFSSWEHAIEFLNSQTVASRHSIGKDIPEIISAADIIEDVPKDILIDFLDQVDNVLIPQRLFEHAENFLMTLLVSSALTRYPDVGERGAKLLQKCKAESKKAQTAISELSCRDLRFPALQKRGELTQCNLDAKRIQLLGSFFCSRYILIKYEDDHFLLLQRRHWANNGVGKRCRLSCPVGL